MTAPDTEAVESARGHLTALRDALDQGNFAAAEGLAATLQRAVMDGFGSPPGTPAAVDRWAELAQDLRALCRRCDEQRRRQGKAVLKTRSAARALASYRRTLH